MNNDYYTTYICVSGYCGHSNLIIFETLKIMDSVYFLNIWVSKKMKLPPNVVSPSHQLETSA